MYTLNHIDVPEKFIGRASFALRVSGDSLEQIYSDSDLLLVEETEFLRHNDLGVFVIGGENRVRRCYKKDGHRQLLPLSADIAITNMREDIKCLGRVLGRA